MTVSKIRIEKLLEMWEAGLTYDEIANRGYSKGTISKYCLHNNSTKRILVSSNDTKIDTKVIKNLLAFLNEIKNTYFNDENKFGSFIETLERHLTLDELMVLETSL